MTFYFFLAGCTIATDEAPQNSPRTVETDRGSYEVTYTPNPDPIPLDDEFDLLISVSSTQESSLGNIMIESTAEMPSHDHGMVQEPIVRANDDGSFTAEGFLFHMSGPWEFYVYVSETLDDGTTNVEQATYEFHCCEQ